MLFDTRGGEGRGYEILKLNLTELKKWNYKIVYRTVK